MKLLKNFVNSNDNTIFIFEDDISSKVKKNYKQIIENAMSNIPNDWDIVYFGRCWDNCNEMKKITNDLYKVTSPLCRHAYGLTKNGAKKILKYTIPMYHNGDKMYSFNIKNGKIKAYAIHPGIFFQNRHDNGTTLGNNNIPYYVSILKSEWPPTCRNYKKNNIILFYIIPILFFTIILLLI